MVRVLKGKIFILCAFNFKSLKSEFFIIKTLSSELCKIVMANESPDKWLDKAAEYINNPTDTNAEIIQKIQSIALEHQVDEYLASLLYASKV